MTVNDNISCTTFDQPKGQKCQGSLFLSNFHALLICIKLQKFIQGTVVFEFWQ